MNKESRRSRVRRRWVISGAAVVVVLLAAGVWIWQSSARSTTPEEAALEYLQALESGDADTVRATGIVVTEAALDAFDAASALVRDAEVTRVRHSNGSTSAAVEVSFELDGDAHDAVLALDLVDGRWRVDSSGLGRVTLDSTIGASVAIGTTAVPTGEAVALLPALYTVSAMPATLLEGESAVTVMPAVEVTTVVDATLRPEATAVAQDHVDDIVEACTVPGTDTPDGCGLRIPWGTEFRDVDGFRYRVEEAPAVTLTPAGFTADGGVLVVTVTGTGADGAGLTTTYRTDSWTLRGDVSFTADDLVLSPW